MTEGPAPEEFEITVFGRGVGESIVVHLGDDSWLIVDSFNGPGGVPVAADYLEGLGVTEDRVKAIVISHFDIDHYRGVDKLVDQYSDAHLHVTAAIDRRWFERLLDVDPDDETLGDLAAAIATARHRAPPGSDSRLRQVSPGMTIMDGHHSKVVAIAPTHHAVNDVDAEIAAALGAFEDGTTPEVRRALSRDNHSSIVLDIQAFGHHVLLGADLETTPERFGWRTVRDRTQETERPASELVKVPHHGSSSSHDENLEELCIDSPVLLVAPNSNHQLPREEDVQRLCGWGSTSWQAAPSAPETTVPGVDVVLGPNEVGWVRARLRADDAGWSIDNSLPGAEVDCDHA